MRNNLIRKRTSVINVIKMDCYKNGLFFASNLCYNTYALKVIMNNYVREVIV